MIDPEKLPDSPVRGLSVDGIWLTSRYDKRREFENMQRAISLLPQELRTGIIAMDCDSKACAVYAVALRSKDTDIASLIGYALGKAFKKSSDGHNGIFLYYNELYGDDLAVIDPDWVGDDKY